MCRKSRGQAGEGIIQGSQVLAFDQGVWSEVRGGGRERKDGAR